MSPIINFSGENVALGPLCKDYLDVYMKCNNDFKTTRTLSMSKPTTYEALSESIDKLSKESSSVFFTIFEKSSDRPIGFTYLDNIDHRNRTATYGIVIGEEDCRGKGYGTETTKLMMNYAFAVLGIHNLSLTVYEFNKPAIRAYEKAGFVQYGRRRQCHFMGGRLWDEILMECLSTEFKCTVPEWNF
jgi:RimJ/RimL family protein N-acetyltransferase